MDRYTQKNKSGYFLEAFLRVNGECDKLNGAVNRLGEYEDTGLMPEEIMDGRMLAGWIPVAERLPSTSGRFEVTIKGSKGKRYVEMCDFQKDANPDWRWGGRYNTKNVIAWRARPVPYKGK